MNIALAGFGQEGKASYDYWNRDDNTLTIASELDSIDDAPEGVRTITGPDAFSKLDEFDLIIRSPGINPKKLPYGDKVWSATNEFFEKCPAQIIGVTGTKGKGTTCSLIASILRAACKTVHLVGNIGVPALSELPNISKDDLVVYELSSFQLWDIKKSPHVAVMLMIEPDHLDVHDDFADYSNAKLNIVRFQSSEDIAIVHDSLSGLLKVPSTEASQVVYPRATTVHAEDGWFYSKNEKLLETSAMNIPGDHNIENACAAIIAAGFVLSSNYDEQIISIIRKGLSDFTGLPHRLKFVAEKNSVKYYDDSIATTPGSAIAALTSFDEPKIIILGGHDKGADYSELIETCERTSSTVIAIGANGHKIARLCEDANVACVIETGNMNAVVERAHQTAGEGSVVILSPAAASFDMFKSYVDRGEQFVAAVTSL